jgi:hypothetical protein
VRAFFIVSQALIPKRCNVLLESVKELPPLQVLEIKGQGLCHDRTVSRRQIGMHPNLWASLWEQSLLAIQATRFNCKTAPSFIASKLCSHRLIPQG